MNHHVVLVTTSEDSSAAVRRLVEAGADVRVVRLDRLPATGLPGHGRVARVLHEMVATLAGATRLPASLERLAGEAEIVVADGAAAVPTVWRLRRRTAAALVSGVPAAEHLLASSGAPSAPPGLA